jgi:rhamnosyltransferase
MPLFESAGIQVVTIQRADFNHGSTRQLAVTLWPRADIVIFLTQDVILAGNADFANILTSFGDEKIGAAYGRQLPRQNAGAIEAHARLYNYPAQSQVKTLSDIPEMGIKTAFMSNSFAAYRCAALAAAGGFPDGVILGEDTCVAARMLQQGWSIAYCAEAQVFHSHDYSLKQEFSRYFDIGVFHGREPWLRRQFSQPEGEGMRYVRSELAYLMRLHPLLVCSALIRNALKLAGYKLGTQERRLPLWLKQGMSMNAAYWNHLK